MLGNVMEDGKTIKDYTFNEKSFIVVMSTVPKPEKKEPIPEPIKRVCAFFSIFLFVNFSLSRKKLKRKNHPKRLPLPFLYLPFQNLARQLLLRVLVPAIFYRVSH